MVEPSPEKVRQNEIWMEELASGDTEKGGEYGYKSRSTIELERKG